MRLQNVNPSGAVYVPMLARNLEAGEVFEVTPEEAARLLPQERNYQRAEGAPLTKPHPRGVPGQWPTPSWWGGVTGNRGWCLLRLRCLTCRKIAGRFIVPEARQDLPPFTVPLALELGEWVTAAPIREDYPTVRGRAQRVQNQVVNPCSCDWSAGKPSPSDPAMRAALIKALSSPTPPAAAFGPGMRAPWSWYRLGLDRGVILTARPVCRGA